MTNTRHGKPRSLDTFVDGGDIRRALTALQRGPISFQRNNVIACEGDAADYIFLVVDGFVRSCKSFENGTRKVVAFYIPGDLFGWDDEKCTLSVEAATEAMVLFIKRRGLVSLARRDSRIANFLLAITRSELQRAQEHALLLGRTAECRVMTFLADLSKRMRNTECVDLPMSHSDIADYLGMQIETLSRTLTQLERSGAIVRASTRRLILKNHSLLTHATD